MKKAPFCEAPFLVPACRHGPNLTAKGCFLLMENDLANLTQGKAGGGVWGQGIVSVKL